MYLLSILFYCCLHLTDSSRHNPNININCYYCAGVIKLQWWAVIDVYTHCILLGGLQSLMLKCNHLNGESQQLFKCENNFNRNWRLLHATEGVGGTIGQSMVLFFCSSKKMLTIRFYCHCAFPFVDVKGKRSLAIIKYLHISLTQRQDSLFK